MIRNISSVQAFQFSAPGFFHSSMIEHFHHFTAAFKLRYALMQGIFKKYVLQPQRQFPWWANVNAFCILIDFVFAVPLVFFSKNQLSSESFSVSELWKMCSSFASSKKKSHFFTVLTPVGRSFSFSIYERIYFCAGQSVALLCENIFDLSSKCDEGNLHQPG